MTLTLRWCLLTALLLTVVLRCSAAPAPAEDRPRAQDDGTGVVGVPPNRGANNEEWESNAADAETAEDVGSLAVIIVA